MRLVIQVSELRPLTWCMPDSSKLMMSHGQSKRHHVTVDLLTEEQPYDYHFLPEAQSSSAQTANRG